MDAKDAISALAEGRDALKPIEVSLRGGVRLTFRRPSNADEFARVSQQARQLARKTQSRENAPGLWAEFLPISEDVAVKCAWIHVLGMAPAWTMAEALALAKKCGPAVQIIHEAIASALAQEVVDSETEALDDLGEGSSETGSGETT